MSYSLAKIAQELGVSKATVSLVLNGKAKQARISSEVEQTVREFCEHVNYVPNIHAQRINKKHVKNIGLLIERDMLIDGDNPFTDPNISGITGGVVLAAEDAGFRVTIQLYSPDIDESKIFQWFYNHEIDGLIYYGLNFPQSWINTFVQERFSVVGIGIAPCVGISSVNINNYELMRALTQQLLQTGKSKLIFIDGSKKSYVACERKRGFLSVVPDATVYDGFFSEQRVYSMITKLLTDGADFDGIVCANDDMAIGAIRALIDYGAQCPAQIAVTGADNIGICRYTSPAVTTIDNKNTELGKTAFSLLLDRLSGNPSSDTVVQSEIIFRQST